MVSLQLKTCIEFRLVYSVIIILLFCPRLVSRLWMFDIVCSSTAYLLLLPRVAFFPPTQLNFTWISSSTCLSSQVLNLSSTTPSSLSSIFYQSHAIPVVCLFTGVSVQFSGVCFILFINIFWSFSPHLWLDHFFVFWAGVCLCTLLVSIWWFCISLVYSVFNLLLWYFSLLFPFYGSVWFVAWIHLLLHLYFLLLFYIKTFLWKLSGFAFWVQKRPPTTTFRVEGVTVGVCDVYRPI